jgi:hypothetical protein
MNNKLMKKSIFNTCCERSRTIRFSIPIAIGINCLFIVITLNSATAQSFFHLSGPEQCWVITHIFVAKKAKIISTEAKVLSEQMKKDSVLDGDGEGGRVDAFRHAYWMARMSQSFCWKKAVKLGKAHEKGNFLQFKKGKKDEESVLPDSVSSAMDIFNNEIGASLGCRNRTISADSLKLSIQALIKEGKLRIIRKDKSKNPLDCEGNLINMKAYTDIWNIPKCLISSDF